MSEQKVLVVDDDQDVSALLTTVLNSAGFEVEAVSSGDEGVERCRKAAPDVVVLDFQLPDIDGQEVCRQIREFSDVYIIMLTSRNTEADKVKSIDLGADDYLTKPFSHLELVTRVKALLRRPRSKSSVTVESLVLDTLTRNVTWDDKPVRLTGIEFRLLLALAEAAPEPVSRRFLLENVWQITQEDQGHMVDVHLSNLRRKLRRAGAPDNCIGNERGVGFRLLFAATTK